MVVTGKNYVNNAVLVPMKLFMNKSVLAKTKDRCAQKTNEKPKK